MDHPREIGPVGASRFGGQQPDRRPVPDRPAAGARPQPAAAADADRVDLTTPQRAALELLRERILACTRGLLGVGDDRHPRFVEGATAGVEAFVDRLVSAQNQLAAARRGTWPDERIERVVGAATQRGVAETIDLLEDVRRLDETTWGVVACVLAELQRKTAAASDVESDP